MCICSSSPVRKKSLHSGRQAIYSSFIRKETWATVIIGEVNTQQSPHENNTRETESSSKQHVERWTGRFQSLQVLHWPDSNTAHHTWTTLRVAITSENHFHPLLLLLLKLYRSVCFRRWSFRWLSTGCSIKPLTNQKACSGPLLMRWRSWTLQTTLDSPTTSNTYKRTPNAWAQLHCKQD